ncbi:hypothetical protein CA51_43100 [Rosistilla oblonga]|nr:hypothetical protein CA51_43100 [Rosistilla oblonga]
MVYRTTVGLKAPNVTALSRAVGPSPDGNVECGRPLPSPAGWAMQIVGPAARVGRSRNVTVPFWFCHGWAEGPACDGPITGRWPFTRWKFEGVVGRYPALQARLCKLSDLRPASGVLGMCLSPFWFKLSDLRPVSGGLGMCLSPFGLPVPF